LLRFPGAIGETKLLLQTNRYACAGLQASERIHKKVIDLGIDTIFRPKKKHTFC